MAEDIAALRARLPYRDCAGAALFNAKGQVLIGKRKFGEDPEKGPELGAAWQMPQGGIDRGEAPLDAARRELYEETSVTSIELIAEAPHWVFYDLPDELRGKLWKGRYIGQRQTWFCCRFTGSDGDIDLEAHDPPEFCEWKWVLPDLLPELIVPFKKDVYRTVVDGFRSLV